MDMRSDMKVWLLAVLFWVPGLAASLPSAAQECVSLAFYNVENLYDTVPSVFYDDRDYTPGGRMGWGGERYGAKLRNLARVIDAMAPDVIGLAEVESERAVRELVMTLRTDYNYIHRTTGDYRGMDVALLYKGDKFILERVRQVPSASGREFLYVRGELLGERVDLVICHLPSQFNVYGRRVASLAKLYRFADSLHRADPRARMVVAGDFNANPTDRAMRRAFRTGRRVADGSVFLFGPLYPMFRRGYGSYVYRDRWNLYDNFFLDNGFLSGDGWRYDRAGIFVREWMLSPGDAGRRGYPLRTFSSGAYTGGFSDHLPVFVELTR